MGKMMTGDTSSVLLGVAAILTDIDPIPILLAVSDPRLTSLGARIRAMADRVIGCMPEAARMHYGNDLFSLLDDLLLSNRQVDQLARSIIVHIDSDQDMPYPMCRDVGKLVQEAHTFEELINTLNRMYKPEDLLYKIDLNVQRFSDYGQPGAHSAILSDIPSLSSLIKYDPSPHIVEQPYIEQVFHETSSMRLGKSPLYIGARSDTAYREPSLSPSKTCQPEVQSTFTAIPELPTLACHRSIIEGMNAIYDHTPELTEPIGNFSTSYYALTEKSTAALVVLLQELVVEAFDAGRASILSAPSEDPRSEYSSGSLSDSKDPFSRLVESAITHLKHFKISSTDLVTLGDRKFIARTWLETKEPLRKAITMCGGHLGLHPIVTSNGRCMWGDRTRDNWVIYDPISLKVECHYIVPDKELYEKCYVATQSALTYYQKRRESYLLGAHTFLGGIKTGKNEFKTLKMYIAKEQSRYVRTPVNPELLFSHYGAKFIMLVLQEYRNHKTWFLLWKLIQDAPNFPLTNLVTLQD